MNISLSEAPESYSRLLLRSLRLYVASFFRVFFLSLILSFIVFIPRLYSEFLGQNLFSTLPVTSPQRLWLTLIDFASLIFFTGVLWRIHCFMTNAHESMVDDIKISLKKFPYILIAGILQNIVFILIFIIYMATMFFYGMFHQNALTTEHWYFDLFKQNYLFLLSFLIPVAAFFYMFFEFYFYLPIILLENQGIISSLKKSVILVWKNWWKVFLLQITPWLIYLICLVIIKNVFKISIHIYYVEPDIEYTIPATLFHLVFFAIFIPFVATTMMVQLKDLELRKRRIDN